MLPMVEGEAPPAAMHRNKSASSGGSLAGLFACFRPDVEEPDSRDVAEVPGRLALFSDVDSVQVGGEGERRKG